MPPKEKAQDPKTQGRQEDKQGHQQKQGRGVEDGRGSNTCSAETNQRRGRAGGHRTDALV